MAEAAAGRRLSGTRFPSDTLLRGPVLRAAQALWIALMGSTLVLFAMAIGPRYRELRAISINAKFVLEDFYPSAGKSWLERFVSTDFYPYFELGLEVATLAGLAVIGFVIFARMPNDWRIISISVGFVTYAAYITPPLDALTVVNPELEIPIRIVRATGGGLSLLFFYLFPGGHFVLRFTKVLAVAWGICNIVGAAFPETAVDFNIVRPHAILGGVVGTADYATSSPYDVTVACFFVLFGFLATGAASQIYRYVKVSSEIERRQTKGVVVAFTLVVLGFAAFVLPRIFLGSLRESGIPNFIYHLIGVPIFFLLLLLVPLFFGISILRHRLWDIEVIVNRALVYATVTATLAGLYFLGIVLLQDLLSPFTQGSRIAVASTTLAVAGLFQPVRNRVQDFIDGHFYRRKYDAAKTLEDFSTKLRDQIDLDALTDELVGVVGETMQPAKVGLWLRAPEEPEEEPRETGARNG